MGAVERAFNYRKVDDHITTSGLVPPDALAELAGDGIDAVIDLLPASVDHAVAGEDDIVRGQGIEYVAIPVDFDAPTHSDFTEFVAAMDAHNGQRVHVHCAANYRVSAFYALYAELRGRWTREQGEAFVADLWDPAEYPAWSRLMDEVRADLSR
ncbi:MAG: protein tyrosine phosphatase family protein [Acidimicrobiia bacterium]